MIVPFWKINIEFRLRDLSYQSIIMFCLSNNLFFGIDLIYYNSYIELFLTPLITIISYFLYFSSQLWCEKISSTLIVADLQNYFGVSKFSFISVYKFEETKYIKFNKIKKNAFTYMIIFYLCKENKLRAKAP